MTPAQKDLPAHDVYLFSPGAAVDDKAFAQGMAVLHRYGLETLQDRHCLSRHPKWPYLAGTDEQRAAAIRNALTGPWRVAMAVRGGYGTLRAAILALSGLQLTRIPLVMGFSDVTALHALLNQRGMVTIHGPNLAGLASVDLITRDRVVRVVEDRIREADLSLYGLIRLSGKGRVHGRLLGGNLSVWCSMLGTGLLPDTTNAILFFEDTGEPLYRIDRMLLQVRLALRSAPPAAVVFGDLIPGNPHGLSFVLKSFARDTGVPVVTGALVGHGSRNLTLALNAGYTLDLGREELVLSDAVLQD